MIATVGLAVLPVSANAQMASSSDVFIAEVASFPDYLQVLISDYADRLIAEKENFSQMDVSNCFFVSDTTALIMQDQGDQVSKGLFLEWIVRSRALGFLSLAKFADNSKPLPGSFAEKLERGELSTEAVVQMLPQENIRCTALLSARSGPVLRTAGVIDGGVK